MSVDDEEHSGWPSTRTMTKIVAISARGYPGRQMMNDSRCSQRQTVVWNVPADFFWTSSICGALQQNLCQGRWAMIKRNTTLLSALSLKNRLKTTPISSPTSLLVMNIGSLGMTWNEAAIISVEDFNFTPTKESTTSSEQFQFDFGLFFDIEGIVHKEFVPPGKTVNGKFYSNALRRLRKTLGTNVQTSGTTTPGPCIMTMHQLMCLFLCSSYWASTKMTVIHHPPYSPDIALCDFFPIPED